MTNSFDELKSIDRKSIPYEQYFGEMDLTKEQKEERISFSEDFESVLLFIFALVGVYVDYKRISEEQAKQYIINALVSRYKAVLGKYIDLDEYLSTYIDKFGVEVIESTIRNLDKAYFLSEDRAKLVSENEANTILNHKDFVKAVAKGKTKKTWIDMRDSRERKTHLAVGGKTIPIEQYFVVGKSLMLYPHDARGDATEVVNCRCSIKYK